MRPIGRRKRKLDEVARAGGEGLMLHLADAPYSTGRSDVLLKLKPLQDTEAVVIEHIPGKGKYAGVLGALRVKTPQGKIFQIGTGFNDATRKIHRRLAPQSPIPIAVSPRQACRASPAIFGYGKNSESGIDTGA